MVRGLLSWRASDANHRGPQNLVVKHVTRLQFSDHNPVGVLGGLNPRNRVMEMRIEVLSHRLDAHEALLRQRLPKLPPNQFEPFAIFDVRGIGRVRQRTIESIEHRKQVFDDRFCGAMAVVMALLFDSLAIVLEIRLAPDKRFRQLLLFSLKLLNLLGESSPVSLGHPTIAFRCGRIDRLYSFRVSFLLLMAVRRHEIQFPVWSSEKNCAIKATAVITRS